MKKWLFLALVCFSFVSGKTAKLYFENAILLVEVADTEALRKRGLMGKKSLEKDTGMLFIFPKPEKVSFWMKDTRLPLSIAFFDETNTLVQIEEMKVLFPEEKPISYRSLTPVKYAVEASQGWFKKNAISIGDRFHFEMAK